VLAVKCVIQFLVKLTKEEKEENNMKIKRDKEMKFK